MTVVINQNELLKAAVVRSDAAAVREHLAAGALPSSRDAQAATPLHWAAGADDAAIVQVLIDAGADVDAVAVDGSTPLHFACREDAEDAAALLLRAGAAADARTHAGMLPIECIYSDVDAPGLVDMLESAGGGRDDSKEVTRGGVLIDRSEQEPMAGQQRAQSAGGGVAIGD